MSLVYNTSFKNDPLGFMDRYAVDPGNAIGNQGVKVADLDPGPKIAEDYAFNDMAITHKVGYLDFNKQTRAGIGLTIGAGAQAPAGLVCISGSYVADPNMVKAYYLPWRDNHIIRLAIPARGTGGADDDTKIFFTAAISGCSVYVKGTPQAPVILHAGGNTHEKNVHMATKFWRDMVLQHPGMGGAGGDEINKTHYVTDAGSLDGQKSTAHSRQFEAWLKNTAVGDLNIEDTAATGCVMGIRDLVGDWSFYLQENITITHSKFKKTIFGKVTDKKVTGSQRRTCRPMIVRKFFPGGLGHAAFVPSMPRVL